MSFPDEIEIQRRYYAETAHDYEQLHLIPKDEHYFALAFLAGVLDYLEVDSVLDVGSGTGRALMYLKKHRPGLRVVGIEPVGELRDVGYKHGLTADELCDGDATKLDFADGEFDIVCEFGVLHHIPKPERAVQEMLRVARKAVFVSDSNNFGQGSLPARTLKQIIHTAHLWKAFDYIKTRGKGYMISEEDGLSYSYSVFDNYRQIEAQCKSMHLLNTQDGRINPYRSAGHVALLGVKK